MRRLRKRELSGYVSYVTKIGSPLYLCYFLVKNNKGVNLYLLSISFIIPLPSVFVMMPGILMT